jgi:hypothetical protein
MRTETLDIINGSFEFFGAYCTWANAYVLFRAKAIRGVYWPTTAFFSLWGLWNLTYYPSLGQWVSFWGGVALVLGNILWVILAIKYTYVGSNA